MNTEATAALAESFSPDAVIAAVGAAPVIPNIPGIHGENVFTAENVYRDHTLVSGHTVILGGGLVGTELAIYLAGLGKHVTVVEMAPRLSDGGNILQGQSIGIELKRLGVDVCLNTKVCEITKSGVVCTCGGEAVVIPADAAVCAFGTAPLSAVADSLRFTAPEFFQIGDCLTSKNIAEATRLAHFAALDLGRFR